MIFVKVRLTTGLFFDPIQDADGSRIVYLAAAEEYLLVKFRNEELTPTNYF